MLTWLNDSKLFQGNLCASLQCTSYIFYSVFNWCHANFFSLIIWHQQMSLNWLAHTKETSLSLHSEKLYWKGPLTTFKESTSSIAVYSSILYAQMKKYRHHWKVSLWLIMNITEEMILEMKRRSSDWSFLRLQ